MKKRIVGAILCAVMCMAIVPVTAFAKSEIQKVEISGFVFPVIGEKGCDASVLKVPDDVNYKVNAVNWFYSEDKIHPITGDWKFEVGKSYYCAIALATIDSSKSGFSPDNFTVQINDGSFGVNASNRGDDWASLTTEFYVVSFDLNGHGTAIDPQIVAKGGTVTEPAKPTTSEELIFGGWYKEKDCKNKWYFGTGYPSSSMTLYARWVPYGTVIDKPVANTGLVYNGKEQVGVEDGDGYTLSGNKRYTRATSSDLLVTAKLKDGYTWSDKTIDNVELFWRIQKKKITVTADSLTKYVGEDDPELTYTADGLVEGDKLEDIKLTRENAGTEEGEKPGKYAIKIEQTKEGNYDYDITFVDGVLEIKEKVPATGDSDYILWIILAAAAVAAGGAIVVFSKRFN